MKRNFSDASREAILRSVEQIDNASYGNLTEWNRDGWNNYADLGYLFDIGAYVDSVNVYHRGVLENLDESKRNIKKIFDEAYHTDAVYAKEMESIRDVANEYVSCIKEMNSIIAPEKKNMKNIDIGNVVAKLMKRTHELQSIFMRNQILRWSDKFFHLDQQNFKKWISRRLDELDDELKKSLIEVLDIAVHSEHVIYESGEEETSDWTKISIFDTLVEISEDEASFAGSLMKWTKGNTALSILGVEYAKKISGIFESETYTTYLAKRTTEYTTEYFSKKEEKEESKMSTEFGFNKLNEKVKDLAKKQNEKFEKNGERKTKEYKKKYYDENGKEISEKEANFLERDLTILETEKTWSKSKSIYENTLNIGDNGTVKTTVGKAEAHAGITGGFYTVKGEGEDAKKIFSPGVAAEIGASVTALEVGWDQQWIESEYVGVSTDVTATVGKVGAKGEANAHIFNEEGDLDVQVTGKVEVEAIAGEIEGKANLDVLGVDMGVKGSLNYGIGAHAEVGYKDGVVKVDIGATLGIGASVGFEVDIGGAVEKVGDVAVDAATAAWDGIQDGWNFIKDGWNSLW